MRLVLLLDTAQNCNCVLNRRLTDEYLLEAPLKCCIFLDVLAVFIKGRCTDHAQLTSGEHWLKHVARIHRAFPAGTSADHGVKFVNESDDLAVTALNLIEHGLESLLELTAILRPGYHRSQIKCDQRLAHQ